MPPILRFRVPQSVVSLIRSLHPEIKRKIRAGLEDILHDPLAGKALKQELSGLRSLRVGQYRIIYKISDKKILEIGAVGPRKKIYSQTLLLVKRGSSFSL
jgi:mRNA interferase RelE/StbE